MSSSAPVLAIDFGTTNSSMAWYDPRSQRAEILRNAEGEEKTLSVVYFGAQETLVGTPAMNEFRDAGDDDEARQRVITSIKRRLLASPVIALPGGQTTRPAEVVAAILGKLKRDAEAGHFREVVRQATLTCPATFNALQRDVLREAAQLAGFDPNLVTLVDEPVAAAVAFAQHGRQVGQGVLVYDLGGGTFDVAVVVRELDGTFRVALEPAGEVCGGDDFDRALYDYWAKAIQAERGRAISLVPHEVDLEFLRECRFWKENLMRNERKKFRAYLPGPVSPPFQTEMERATFEGLIEEAIARTAHMTQTMFARAQEAGHPVDTVVLIGGSSRLPLVEERLQAALPVALRPFQGANIAVALGAAYYPHVSAPPPPAFSWYRLAPRYREFLAAGCSRTQVWGPGGKPLPGDGVELLRSGLACDVTLHHGEFFVCLDIFALLAAGRLDELRGYLTMAVRDEDTLEGDILPELDIPRYMREFFVRGDPMKALRFIEAAQQWGHPVRPALLLAQGYGEENRAQQYLQTTFDNREKWDKLPGHALRPLPMGAKMWKVLFADEARARDYLQKIEALDFPLYCWFERAETWMSLFGDAQRARRCLQTQGTANLTLVTAWMSLFDDTTAARDCLQQAQDAGHWLECAKGWKKLFDDEPATRHCLQQAEVSAKLCRDWIDCVDGWMHLLHDLTAARNCLHLAQSKARSSYDWMSCAERRKHLFNHELAPLYCLQRAEASVEQDWAPFGSAILWQGCAELWKRLCNDMEAAQRCLQTAEAAARRDLFGGVLDWTRCARDWKRLCNDMEAARRCLQTAEKNAMESRDWVYCAKGWKDLFDADQTAQSCLQRAEKIARCSKDWEKCADGWQDVFADTHRVRFCLQKAAQSPSR